jgi:hypothetical protein
LNSGNNIVFTALGYSGTVDWVSNGSGSVNGNQVTFTSSATGTKTVVARSAQVYSSTLTCYSSTVSGSATVNAVPTNPTFTAGSRCGTGTVVLIASSSGSVIDWYEAPTGGSALLSGNNSYSTPSLSASKTYYAQARNSTTNCVSAARVAVQATVLPAPAAPTGASANTACGSGAVTFSATVPNDCTIAWYNASSGGTIVSGGSDVTSFSP